jgi:hypothetical protein
MRKIAFTSIIIAFFLALVLLSACDEYAGEAFRVIKQRQCSAYEEIHCDGNTLVTSTRLVSCKINIEKRECAEFCSEVAGDCVTTDEWEELVRQNKIQQGEAPQPQGEEGQQGDQGDQQGQQGCFARAIDESDFCNNGIDDDCDGLIDNDDSDCGMKGCTELYGEGFECLADADVSAAEGSCTKSEGTFTKNCDTKCVVPCEGGKCLQLVLGCCVKCAMPEQGKPQCSDGFDNDKDGLIDFGDGKGNDPGCESAEDDDESDVIAPVDTDGDGYSSDEDCDDDNPAVNPGADEDCKGATSPIKFDGIDNDCDGKTDLVDTDCYIRDCNAWFGDGTACQEVHTACTLGQTDVWHNAKTDPKCLIEGQLIQQPKVGTCGGCIQEAQGDCDLGICRLSSYSCPEGYTKSTSTKCGINMVCTLCIQDLNPQK